MSLLVDLGSMDPNNTYIIKTKDKATAIEGIDAMEAFPGGVALKRDGNTVAAVYDVVAVVKLKDYLNTTLIEDDSPAPVDGEGSTANS